MAVNQMKVGGRGGRSAGAAAMPTRSSGICDLDLEVQNKVFSGTGGVSSNNRTAGFVPAYCNHSTGEAVISVYADGSQAPVHVLEGLPEAWIAVRDAQGVVVRTHDSVEAGFMRDGCFFTRQAAAQAISEES